MPLLLRPPRPLPASPEPSPPPPPGPPVAAAEVAERPLPRMTKIKLLFPRAVSAVFGGMNRACGVALVWLHAGFCVVKVVSFTMDPEVAVPILRAWLYLGLAAMLLSTCMCIYYYCLPVHGVDAVKDNLPKQQLAAAAEVQLPPPPPEMDMC